MAGLAFSATAVAVSAAIGSSAGAFSNRRFTAVLWSAPLVVAMHALATFVAPYIPDDAGWSTTLVDSFAGPVALLQGCVACATGAVVASSLVAFVTEQRSSAVWFPWHDSSRVKLRPTLPSAPAPRPRSPMGDRIAALAEQRPRRPAPLPVVEIAPSAPAFTNLAPAAPQPVVEHEGRASPRRRTLLSGALLLSSGNSLPCRIENLSIEGAKCRLPTTTQIEGDVVLIDVSNAIAHEATVAWVRGGCVGVHFRRSHDVATPKTETARALHAEWLAAKPR